MGEPRGPVVGAELAELYKKAQNVMPLVIAELTTASSKVGQLDLYSAQYRSGGYNGSSGSSAGTLGVGSHGCDAEFNAAVTKICERLTGVGSYVVGDGLSDALEVIRLNVIKTVRDMADVDQETADAFTRLGGSFGDGN